MGDVELEAEGYPGLRGPTALGSSPASVLSAVWPRGSHSGQRFHILEPCCEVRRIKSRVLQTIALSSFLLFLRSMSQERFSHTRLSTVTF